MPDRRGDDDGYDPDRWDARFIIARDGPRELEDGVHRRTMASLNNGWLARGGLLRLHDDHLSFTPSPLDRLLFARLLRIELSDLTAVERHPARREEILPGGRAPRMRLVTSARSFDFLFPSGLDNWLSAVAERQRIWEIRKRFA